MEPTTSSSVTKTARQPHDATMKPPIVGASNGDTAMNRNNDDRIFARLFAGKKSRTMASDATCAPQPPRPCRKRIATSISTLVDSAQPREATQYKVRPAARGGLRPKRSSSGP
jgi:hypothetical protein